MRVLIICDSFGIGGIERLALDQSYQLNKQGMFSEILILSDIPSDEKATFPNNEKELIEQLSIKIRYLPGSRLKQFIELFKIVDKGNYNYIFAYSLKGTVLAKLCRFRIREKYLIITTICQLPSLSAPLQRVKRFFYSQFTDKLFIFSLAALKDWENNKRNIVFRMLLLKRGVELLRTGVYLPRIPVKDIVNSGESNNVNRLVFIGRLTEWKGFKTFLDLAQLPQLNHCRILIVTPTDPKSYLLNLDTNFQKRVICVIGKSISRIDFKKGDLHIYPANHVNNSEFIEGISINVLEMASLGVPSLITKNGAETWPELTNLGIVIEVDWNNLNLVADFIKGLTVDFQDNDVQEIRNIVSIQNNLNSLLS